jgi:hypothetical protein
MCGAAPSLGKVLSARSVMIEYCRIFANHLISLSAKRLRGVTNLRRQSLVHFGDDVVADEIKDFVKMCDRDGHDEVHNAMNFRRSFRRQSAFRAKKT